MRTVLAVALAAGVWGCASGSERQEPARYADLRPASGPVIEHRTPAAAAQPAPQSPSGGPVSFGAALAATAPSPAPEATSAKQAAPAAPSDQCAANREERMRELAAYLEHRDRIHDLQAWEGEHCRYEDNSKPTTYQVEDSRGEIHSVEGRSRGVDRKCDAKLPSELVHVYARDMSAGQPPYRPESMTCRSEDIAASPIAARYWSESKRRY